MLNFTRIDYEHELALIAVVSEANHEKEIAVARYVKNPEGTSCEFAIVVADAWQHRGIGTRLMDCLMQVAKEQGLQIMEGFVLATNHRMLALMDALGFRITGFEGDLDQGGARSLAKAPMRTGTGGLGNHSFACVRSYAPGRPIQPFYASMSASAVISWIGRIILGKEQQIRLTLKCFRHADTLLIDLPGVGKPRLPALANPGSTSSGSVHQ
jgi:GNAT superfamily N-acetyltransferase